jgi:hypothetical protein
VHLFAADNDDDLLDWLNSLQYVAFGEHSAVDPRNLVLNDESQVQHNYSTTSMQAVKPVTQTEMLNNSKNGETLPTASFVLTSNGTTSVCSSNADKLKSMNDPVQQENQLYCSLDQPDVFRVTIAPTDAAMRCRLRVLIAPSIASTGTVSTSITSATPNITTAGKSNKVSNGETSLLSSISSNQSKLSESLNEAEYGNVSLSLSTARSLPCTYLLQFNAVSISVYEDLRPHSQPPTAGVCLYVWPFRHIRRYGCTPEAFSLEAGRKCDSGAGMFCFHSSNAQTIFRKLASYVNALRQEEQLNPRPSTASLDNNSKIQVKTFVSSAIDSRSLSPHQSSTNVHSTQTSNNCFSSSSGCSSNGSSTPSSGSASPFVPPELPSRCRPNEIANRSADLGSPPLTIQQPIAVRPFVDNRTQSNSTQIKHPKFQTNRSLPPDLLNELPTKNETSDRTFLGAETTGNDSTSNALSNSCTNLKNSLTSKTDVQSISGALRRQLNQSMPQLGNEPLYYQKHSIQIPLSGSQDSTSEINNNHHKLNSSSDVTPDECMYDSVADDPTDPTDPIFQSRQDLFGRSDARSSSSSSENTYEMPESGYSELRFSSNDAQSEFVQLVSCEGDVRSANDHDRVDSDLISSLLSKATVDHRITAQLPAETVRNLNSVLRSVLGTSALQRIKEGDNSRNGQRNVPINRVVINQSNNNNNNPFCGPQCLAASEASKDHSDVQFADLYEPLDIRPIDMVKKLEPEHYVHNECEYARVIKRSVVIEHL